MCPLFIIEFDIHILDNCTPSIFMILNIDRDIFSIYVASKGDHDFNGQKKWRLYSGII